MRIEMFLDKNKKPRIRLRSRNGRILMSSEAYVSRRNAEDTVSTIINDFYTFCHDPSKGFDDIFKDLTKEKK